MTPEQAREKLRIFAGLSHVEGEGALDGQEKRQLEKVRVSLMKALTTPSERQMSREEAARKVDILCQYAHEVEEGVNAHASELAELRAFFTELLWRNGK